MKLKPCGPQLSALFLLGAMLVGTFACVQEPVGEDEDAATDEEKYALRIKDQTLEQTSDGSYSLSVVGNKKYLKAEIVNGAGHVLASSQGIASNKIHQVSLSPVKAVELMADNSLTLRLTRGTSSAEVVQSEFSLAAEVIYNTTELDFHKMYARQYAGAAQDLDGRPPIGILPYWLEGNYRDANPKHEVLQRSQGANASSAEKLVQYTGFVEEHKSEFGILWTNSQLLRMLADHEQAEVTIYSVGDSPRVIDTMPLSLRLESFLGPVPGSIPEL